MGNNLSNSSECCREFISIQIVLSEEGKTA